jgi:hypothetical protein
MEVINPRDVPSKPEEIVKDIRNMMERGSRFISLSGLSGIAAGVCALAGSWVAARMLDGFGNRYNNETFRIADPDPLFWKLVGLAMLVFVAALATAFIFTWRRSRKMNIPFWNPVAKKLVWNLVIPLFTGAVFIFMMIQNAELRFIAPACLVFYGLGLINASKYTLTDIRFLGYVEVLLGLVNMEFLGQGLLFWAIGFGVMHILYGAIMWFKYER